MKKKILYPLISLILSFILMPKINAASASISVRATSQASVGSTITATVTISSSTKIGSWEYLFNYDKSKLTMTSYTSNTSERVSGYDAYGRKTITYTYKFKAKATGTASISVGNYEIADVDGNIMSVSKRGASIRITKASTSTATDDKTYSSNNYLSSLSVDGYDLNPKFNKNTLEYKIELPNETENINIKATKEDSKATISGIGNVKVSEGNNKITIKVTAENGNERKYIINATVKEADPIIVSILGENYTVVRKENDLPSLKSYVKTTAIIDGNEVPALESDITGYTLVGLKDKNGKIDMYVYDGNGTYILYKEINFNYISLYSIEIEDEKIPDGYKKEARTINEVEVTAYVNSDAEFPLLYGINLETGETGFYKYDEKENTLQRFDDKEIKKLKKKNEEYLYCIIGLGSLALLLIIILIIALASNNKKKMKKINSKLDNKEENIDKPKKEKKIKEKKVKEKKIKEKNETKENLNDENMFKF